MMNISKFWFVQGSFEFLLAGFSQKPLQNLATGILYNSINKFDATNQSFVLR